MADFRTLDDLDVRGKRVLVRADLNVPVKDGVVTDRLRIERQAPTIRELAEKGARVIVLSHFDRPKGKVVPSMSLRPVAGPLAEAVGRPVGFDTDTAAMTDGGRRPAENTRFDPGEEKNDIDYARRIAALGDIFVNDAFSAAHRAHATTEAIAHLLPAAAGRSMQAELEHLDKALGDPQRPVMAVVGGAKVSTKIALLENLVKRVETLVIGGAMANTFLAAEGIEVGRSLVERDHIETALSVIHLSTEAGCAVILPVDAVVAHEFKAHARHRTVDIRQVSADEMILDVGPKTVAEFERRLVGTRTLVWNGPFGRLRDGTLRPRHGRGGQGRGRGHQGGRPAVGGGRRRHGGRAQPCRRLGRLHLRLDGGRRIPRMAGRTGPAGRRGAQGKQGDLR